jgi:RNA polymerase sigma-70 factor (ECF subfamily)
VAKAVDGPWATDTLSENELRDGLQAGNPEALKALIRNYQPALVRYASGLCGGNIDAEGVVQEAFIKLWEKRDRWRSEGSLKVLLFTITRNLSVDAYRKTRRESRLSDRRLDTLSSPSPGPDQQLLEEELASLAEAAIAGLPKRRQEIFRLVRENGFSYRQVAEILEISPQTVANLMSLALAELRSSLHPFLKPALPQNEVGPKKDSRAEASGSD